MAKTAKAANSAPVIPDFRDVDASAVNAAREALNSGISVPLTPPKGAQQKMDAKNEYSYTRWAENATVTAAYRSVTKSGLLDVTVALKIRQSDEPKNNGKLVWAHFFLNMGSELSEGHEKMNTRSLGTLATLLAATGYLPASGALKAALLSKMFPQKNQPGTASPLIGKSVVANITQQYGPKKDTNRKIVKDDEGEVIMESRDSVDQFFPDEAEDDK